MTLISCHFSARDVGRLLYLKTKKNYIFSVLKISYCLQLIHTVAANPQPLVLDLKKLFGRLTFLTSISNPIMYTILFTECRLQLVILLCFWNKKLLNVYKRKSKERMCTYFIQSISKSIEFNS